MRRRGKTQRRAESRFRGPPNSSGCRLPVAERQRRNCKRSPVGTSRHNSGELRQIVPASRQCRLGRPGTQNVRAVWRPVATMIISTARKASSTSMAYSTVVVALVARRNLVILLASLIITEPTYLLTEGNSERVSKPQSGFRSPRPGPSLAMGKGRKEGSQTRSYSFANPSLPHPHQPHLIRCTCNHN